MHFSLRIGHSSVIILLWKGQPQKDQHERLFGDDGTSSACVEEGAGPALDYRDLSKHMKHMKHKPNSEQRSKLQGCFPA